MYNVAIQSAELHHDAHESVDDALSVSNDLHSADICSEATEAADDVCSSDIYTPNPCSEDELLNGETFSDTTNQNNFFTWNESEQSQVLNDSPETELCVNGVSLFRQCSGEDTSALCVRERVPFTVPHSFIVAAVYGHDGYFEKVSEGRENGQLGFTFEVNKGHATVFFAASGHNLYLKSGHVYLQSMLKLETDHPEIFRLFDSGHHVLRRSDRYWAGLSPDLVIEQVLMRSVKTSGGMTRGKGMTESQRSQWLLSMPDCAEYNNRMQMFTGVEYQSSEQHKEKTVARKERDENDTMKILSFLQDKDPFAEDDTLRNIVAGIAADDSVNVDKARDVGVEVLKSMAGNTVVDFSFKRSKQAVNLLTKAAVKVEGEPIQIDPQLLFQLLVSVADRVCEDISTVFSFELCSHPASLFDASGLPREAQKPSLADAIRSLGDCSMVKQPDSEVKYVIDGGSLLQRIPWTNSTTFRDVCDRYSEYLHRRYQNTSGVFDGYSAFMSTKDITHMRRSKGKVSPLVKFTEVTPLKSKKDLFLSNAENKQCFINMLSSHLEKNGFKTAHASNDADVVQTAVECAQTQPTILVGEDTDLLVLLCYHADMDNHDLFFTSHSSPATGKKMKIWDIKRTKAVLGPEICRLLPFVHAMTGCDTTSSIFGIGKGPVLKKVKGNSYLKSQAEVFCRNSTKDEVVSAGEEALSCLYGGVPLEGLDLLRFRAFSNKVTSCSSYVKVHSLPPTTAAARYHSKRVYLQVHQWIQQGSNLDPCEWGWYINNDKLLPIKTDKQPAPDNLLKVIRCNCKVNCDNKRCNYRKHGLECSAGCGHCHGMSCSNSQVLNDNDLNNEV